MSELEIFWSIEAPIDSLFEATEVARINKNAINPGKIDADLIFPSFFCPSRPEWMKVLAFLYVRNIQFRLFLFAVNGEGFEKWRYRMHPGMDAEMLSFMREIDATETQRLVDLEESMKIVAERLRRIVPDDFF
ncbi:MAG: hypothetical protein P8N43_07965 [Alphaproteobacteria bacterium]|jgi:hypothetical protein|nr:hypothetical protein [Alphaproteobacteria bacterium]